MAEAGHVGFKRPLSIIGEAGKTGTLAKKQTSRTFRRAGILPPGFSEIRAVTALSRESRMPYNA